VEIATGVTTTIAGTAGTLGNTDNATGTLASFYYPSEITTDGTDLFVTQPVTHTIRKVNILTGAVTTVAGAVFSAGTTDGVGSLARFGSVEGITTDGTNLYVTDNQTIRKVEISTATVTTIAGSPGVSGSSDGVGPSGLFNAPVGITADGTSLYVVDRWNHALRKIRP
jgi:hypothetical protein